MGTWGDGLYDNDGALDELGDLFESLDMHASAVALATTVGLRTWLNAPPTDAMMAAVREHADWLPTLPPPAREKLELLARDANRFGDGRARSADVKALLGGYCDGPKYDALLSLPGAQAIISELAKSAAERLDDGLEAASDLYEAASAVAYLGVLLELVVAGSWTAPSDSVARWRRAASRIDAATKEERGFWDEYVARLCRALDLLAKQSA